MKILILAAAALIAAPSLAQPSPPAPQQAAHATDSARPHGKMQRGRMFASLSPEGRIVLAEAMRGSPEDRAAVKAARDRINTLVGADKLDAGALKRAMDEERRLMDGQRAKRQQMLLSALQKLSVEDRKAFAADADKARAGVERRTSEWRKRREDRGTRSPDGIR